jgi:hypothetical protein
MDDDLAGGPLAAHVVRRLLRVLQAEDEVDDGTDAPSASSSSLRSLTYALPAAGAGSRAGRG